MIKLPAMAAASLLLAACTPLLSPPPAPASAFTADAAYCYRALARNECYAQPQLGEEYRYLGDYPVPRK